MQHFQQHGDIQCIPYQAEGAINPDSGIRVMFPTANQLPWTNLLRVGLGKAILTLTTLKTFDIERREPTCCCSRFQVPRREDPAAAKDAAQKTLATILVRFCVFLGCRRWQHASSPKEGLKDVVTQMQPRTDPCPLLRNRTRCHGDAKSFFGVSCPRAPSRKGATMVGPPSAWRPMVNMWAHNLRNTATLRTSR